MAIIGDYGKVTKTTDTIWRQTNATGIAGGPDTADNQGVGYPKFKFNFTVLFTPRYVDLPHQGGFKMEEMAFGLKTAGRPKTTINYDDINFYNFRTKVAKTITHNDMSLSFYDDPNNFAHDIVTQYLSQVSPLFGRYAPEADNLDNNGQSSAAGIGPLSGNRHGPFKSIIVTQYFGYKYDDISFISYEYLNPKIMTAELDDLDMSASEFSTVSITFTYDTFNIVKG